MGEHSGIRYQEKGGSKERKFRKKEKEKKVKLIF